jgi:hypothetical protein
MTQLSPSTSIYARALARLKDLELRYAEGDIASPEDYVASIREIGHSVFSEGEKPNLFYDFIEHGEPTLSHQENRFWSSMSSDVNIAYDQINYLKAHTISSYNNLTTSLKKASNENARLRGKLKSLEIYSGTISDNIRIFGDFFANYDLINLEQTPTELTGDIYSPGSLILGLNNVVDNLLRDSIVTVGSNSNGFRGRNHEVEPTESSSTNPVTGDPEIIFKAEKYDYSNVNAITDNQPSTWLEYESNWISDLDKLSAGNLGFRFKTGSGDDGTTYLDWASGPESNVLKLVLDFDIGSVSKANSVVLTPHKVSELASHPIKVSRVSVSADGSNWTVVSSKPIWIGNDINLSGTSSEDEIVIGTAFWAFQEQSVRFLKMEIEQVESIASTIGHIYYENDPAVSTGLTEDALPVLNSATRVEGPIPDVNNPIRYYNPSQSIQNGLVQKRETFEGKRWAIGIKDISLYNTAFKESSVVVSKKFIVDGIIDRISLEADYEVPDGFSTNSRWIEFFVSPNDGIDWFQISNIKDDFNDIPEIIAFNDPLPKEFREAGVKYHNVSGSVDSLVLRIEMSRPSDLKSSTPVLHSYKLKALKR